MDNSTPNQDVEFDHLGLVHVYGSLFRPDGNQLSSQGQEPGLLLNSKGWAEGNLPADDVISEYVRKLGRRHFAGERANGGESLVVGSKDGEIVNRVEGINKTRLREEARYSRQTVSNSCSRNVRRDVEDSIDDVNNSAFKLNVLFRLLACPSRTSRADGNRFVGTNRLDHPGHKLQARNDNRLLPPPCQLDMLTSSNVAERRAIQQCVWEGWCLFEVASLEGPIDNMILKQLFQQLRFTVLLLLLLSFPFGLFDNFFKSFVVWCKECDVFHL